MFRVDGTGKGYFDGGTHTGGVDFAESVAVAKEFAQHEPCDLLIMNATGKRQLKLSSEPYSTLVAGIYSTKPGVLATPHKMDEAAANEPAGYRRHRSLQSEQKTVGSCLRPAREFVHAGPRHEGYRSKQDAGSGRWKGAGAAAWGNGCYSGACGASIAENGR